VVVDKIYLLSGGGGGGGRGEPGAGKGGGGGAGGGGKFLVRGQKKRGAFALVG